MTASPLHIAIDVGPLHGHRTGVGLAVEGITTELARRDDVALLPYLTSFRAPARPGQRKLPLPGIAASHLWSRSERPRADRWLRGADVVHGTNYVAPPTGLATVVSVYDCWFLAHRDQATPLVRRAGGNLHRAVARGAWIHTTSAATAHRVRELLGTERVAVVPLGAPAPPPALRSLPRPDVDLDGRPFVLAIGTEERRKDVPLLVAAFGLVAGRDPAPLLVIAGAAGDDSDRIDGAIEALPPAARDRIRRLGPVTDDAKHWLLRQAAVLAYPSLDEGFGFPVLEAQSASTPVVACAVGSIPEVAGDGAALVADRDPATLADTLLAVIGDGRLRLALIESGLRNVGRFRWDAAAAGLVDLYHRALGEPRR